MTPGTIPTSGRISARCARFWAENPKFRPPMGICSVCQEHGKNPQRPGRGKPSWQARGGFRKSLCRRRFRVFPPARPCGASLLWWASRLESPGQWLPAQGKCPLVGKIFRFWPACGQKSSIYAHQWVSQKIANAQWPAWAMVGLAGPGFAGNRVCGGTGFPAEWDFRGKAVC